MELNRVNNKNLSGELPLTSMAVNDPMDYPRCISKRSRVNVLMKGVKS